MSAIRLTALAFAALLLAPGPYCAAAEQSPETAGSGSSASSSGKLSTPEAVKHDAHRFGEAVKRDSVQFGHEVARGAREFKHSMQDWWSKMKSGSDHSRATARAPSDST